MWPWPCFFQSRRVRFPDLVRAVAEQALIRGDHALLEGGQRCNDLERRTGREMSLQRAVVQRGLAVRHQLPPLVGRHAACERVGVEGGSAHQRQHRAGMDVEGDNGALFPLQRVVRRSLNVQVQGQHHVVSGRRLETIDDPHLAAGGVHLHLFSTAASGQMPLPLLFEAGLPDGVPAPVAPAAQVLQLLGVDLAQVAEQVRGHRVRQVAAPRLDADVHPRKVRPMGFHRHHGRPIDVADKRDPFRPLGAANGFHEALAVAVDHVGEAPQGGLADL